MHSDGNVYHRLLFTPPRIAVTLRGRSAREGIGSSLNLVELNLFALSGQGEWVTAEIVLNGLDRIFRILIFAKHGFHAR